MLVICQKIKNELVIGPVFPFFAYFIGPFVEEHENIIFFTAFASIGRIVNSLIYHTELIMHSMLFDRPQLTLANPVIYSSVAYSDTSNL